MDYLSVETMFGFMNLVILDRFCVMYEHLYVWFGLIAGNLICLC